MAGHGVHHIRIAGQQISYTPSSNDLAAEGEWTTSTCSSKTWIKTAVYGNLLETRVNPFGFLFHIAHKIYLLALGL